VSAVLGEGPMNEPSSWDATGRQDSGQYPAQAPYQGHLRPALALNAVVPTATAQLKPVTIEARLARSGLWLRSAA